jgi:hypothetical protein
MEWIIGLLVGLVVVLLVWALVNRSMFLKLLYAPCPKSSAPLAAPRFEVKSSDEIEQILGGCNERDPVLCAVLSLLHQAQAEAAEDSNDPRLPEHIARKADGGLQYLLEFEADVKMEVRGQGAEVS